MRLSVSPEQLKFFQLNGYLELEGLISEEESDCLIAEIRKVASKSPGYPEENIFRSAPIVANLARKLGWGQIAVELLHKKPLRIASDYFWSKRPENIPRIYEESCGLLLDLASQRAIFFKTELPSSVKLDPNGNYFLLVFSAKHLPESIHPVVSHD